MPSLPRPAAEIVLANGDARSWEGGRDGAPVRTVLRCAPEYVGHRRWRDGRRVGRSAGTGSRTIPKWSNRFVEDRCDDVLNEPRPGPPRVLGDAQIDRLINATLKTTPRCHALVTRSNAMHLGLSQSDGKTA